ncbi:MAG: T9SS type A sorting domain-containing protein [Flavobacteriales bacterium]
MKRTLHLLLSTALIFALQSAFAQRYLDEVFTDDEIIMTSVTYGTNINFLTSNLAGANTASDVVTLQTAAALGTEIPAAYFDPTDTSTDVKVTNVAMDIYQPDQAVDEVTERPVIIYVHTGNFLPPPLNGSPNGRKDDKVAIELCQQWAKRGYVAVSIEYRLGWNPIAETVQERTGTLLNAVYRAIHDVKHGVRTLRRDAIAENTYGIDESRIALYGQGSGGYVSQAYVTLDNPSVELFLEKFRPDPFDASVSYIDTLAVGNPEGLNGTLTLYQNADNISSEVHMSANAGGALADESWLEAGDVPMVSFHSVRDDFAPFTEGTVIVPTTNEPVVAVMGSNFFIQKANDLGNNDVFASIPDGDVYTDAARALYGQSFEASLGVTETVNDTPEGLYPIVLPLTDYLQNQASPWEWWDPTSPLAMAVVGMIGDIEVTAHMNSLGSNPDMSETKSLTYLDTIQGYFLPRVMCALELPGALCNIDNVQDIANSAKINMYPNPASNLVAIESDEIIQSIAVYNVAGKLVATLEGKAGNRLEFSVAEYTPGFYSLQVRTTSGIYSEQLIKE